MVGNCGHVVEGGPLSLGLAGDLPLPRSAARKNAGNSQDVPEHLQSLENDDGHMDLMLNHRTTPFFLALH